MKLAVPLIVVALAIVGCHTAVKEEHDTAELKIGSNGISFKANDSQGSKADLEITEGHLHVNDEKGNGMKMDLDKNGIKMSAKGEEGSFENNVAIAESDLGVPFYPGSQEFQMGNMRADAKEGKVNISMRTTQDAPSKVIDFYKEKLSKTTLTTTETDGHKRTELKGTAADGHEISITAETDDQGTRTTIAVASKR